MKRPKTIVRTVKGDHAAVRLINQMEERGYVLDNQSSRKVLWSPVTGVFTRKQKHTLTFRDNRAPTKQSNEQRGAFTRGWPPS